MSLAPLFSSSFFSAHEFAIFRLFLFSLDCLAIFRTPSPQSISHTLLNSSKFWHLLPSGQFSLASISTYEKSHCLYRQTRCVSFCQPRLWNCASLALIYLSFLISVFRWFFSFFHLVFGFFDYIFQANHQTFLTPHLNVIAYLKLMNCEYTRNATMMSY